MFRKVIHTAKLSKKPILRTKLLKSRKNKIRKNLKSIKSKVRKHHGKTLRTKKSRGGGKFEPSLAGIPEGKSNSTSGMPSLPPIIEIKERPPVEKPRRRRAM